MVASGAIMQVACLVIAESVSRGVSQVRSTRVERLVSEHGALIGALWERMLELGRDLAKTSSTNMRMLFVYSARGAKHSDSSNR